MSRYEGKKGEMKDCPCTEPESDQRRVPMKRCAAALHVEGAGWGSAWKLYGEAGSIYNPTHV